MVTARVCNGADIPHLPQFGPGAIQLFGNRRSLSRDCYLKRAYYSDNRIVTDGVSKLGMQLGLDMAENVL